jgi:DNA-binding transcriptional ArsR family regulator
MTIRNETLFKALADGQRRKILSMLRGREMAAGQIASRLDLTPATVSHHLALLKGAELVRVRREGQSRIYTINVSVVEEALMLLAKIIRPEKGEAV